MKIISALLNKDHVSLTLGVEFDSWASTGPRQRGLTISGIWEIEEARAIVFELDPSFQVDKIEVRNNWNPPDV